MTIIACSADDGGGNDPPAGPVPPQHRVRRHWGERARCSSATTSTTLRQVIIRSTTPATSANQPTAIPAPDGNPSSKRPVAIALTQPDTLDGAVDDARARMGRRRVRGRPQITMPYGVGDTTDLTHTLTVLKLAGLRAVVESHDTIRLADAAAHASNLTQRPRDDDPNDAELLLLAPRTVHCYADCARGADATVLLVDVDRRRVWIDGRQALGPKNDGKTPPPPTSPSPSRGCSPSTAAPSTGWCGLG